MIHDIQGHHYHRLIIKDFVVGNSELNQTKARQGHVLFFNV